MTQQEQKEVSYPGERQRPGLGQCWGRADKWLALGCFDGRACRICWCGLETHKVRFVLHVLTLPPAPRMDQLFPWCAKAFVTVERKSFLPSVTVLTWALLNSPRAGSNLSFIEQTVCASQSEKSCMCMHICMYTHVHMIYSNRSVR